jgi:hypothetical protein
VTTTPVARHRSQQEATVPRRTTAARLSRWAGAFTTLTPAAAWILVMVVPGAPPRSGANCTGGPNLCLTYPYTDAAAFVPGDFPWMIPAFLLGLLLIVLLTGLLRATGAPRLPGPQDYSARTDYRPPARWYQRLNRLLGVPLTSLGWAPRDAATLEVRGRSTGRTRRTPVLITHLGTDRYLVALAGRSHWVRNVRAAGGQAWLRRRGRTAVSLEELPAAERPPILLAYLHGAGRDDAPSARTETATHYFGLDPDPDLADLAAIADHYPVFRIHDAEPT